jgi:addiction module RelE/StbE family toxin
MAMDDRETIMDHIGQDNPVAAISLDEEFEAKAEIARQRSTLYRAGRVKDTREIVVRPSYVMVYHIEEDGNTVAVPRVLHAARQWPPAGRE